MLKLKDLQVFRVESLMTNRNGMGFFVCTRGIWKVLSMVFYLSNRFTNPIMFGIILKNYLSSMLWHKFLEDIMMQTRKILFMYCLYTVKRKISVVALVFCQAQFML